MKTYHSFSSKETEKFGEQLALKAIGDWRLAIGKKHALVFALQGDLGSGKTTFVKGFFRGIGIKSRAKSPTFIIFRRSVIRGSKFKNLYHVDAYRLKKSKDLAGLGFKEIISDERNIILIEWPENVKGMIPHGAYRLKFHYGEKENERTIITRF